MEGLDIPLVYVPYVLEFNDDEMAGIVETEAIFVDSSGDDVLMDTEYYSSWCAKWPTRCTCPPSCPP